MSITIKQTAFENIQITQSQSQNVSHGQFECRICISTISNKNNMQNVCKCKGSSGAIHEQCLIKWIQKSEKYYRKGVKQYFNCEVCRHSMELETKMRAKWCKEGEKWSIMYTILNILVLFLAIASILLIILPRMLIIDEDKKIIGDVLMPIGIFLLVADLSAYVIYHLVFEREIVGVKKYELQIECINKKSTIKSSKESDQTAPETAQNINLACDESQTNTQPSI